MSEDRKETEAGGMTFPCRICVRAMGLAEDDFDALVVEIVRRHCPDLGEGAVTLHPSRTGKYVSVNVVAEFHSREQLDALYDELTANERVLMRL